MGPETPAIGPKNLPQDSELGEDNIFAEDVEQSVEEHLATLEEQRQRNSIQRSPLANEMSQVDFAIAVEEDKRGTALTTNQRVDRYETALRRRLSESDTAAATALPHSADNNRQRERFVQRMAVGETRLNVLRSVAEAEVEDDPVEQAKRRKAAVAFIRKTLRLSKVEATAIYDYFAANPSVYREAVETEKMLAVLEHQPDRVQELTQLLKANDQVGVDRLISEIATTNAAFAERISHLGDHRKLASRWLQQISNPAIKIEAMIGEQSFTDKLAPEEQLAIADALESIDQPVVETFGRLPFSVSDDGLRAPWLGSTLHVKFKPDAGHQVYLDDVAVLGGIGRSFFTAAVIAQVQRKDRGGLPVSSWRELTKIVGCLGPKFQSPASDDVNDAVRAIGMLKLDDPETLQSYRIVARGSSDIESQSLWRFRNQVAAIIDDVGLDENLLSSDVLVTISDYWEQLKAADHRPFIMSVNQINDLLRTGTS